MKKKFTFLVFFCCIGLDLGDNPNMDKTTQQFWRVLRRGFISHLWSVFITHPVSAEKLDLGHTIKTRLKIRLLKWQIKTPKENAGWQIENLVTPSKAITAANGSLCCPLK